MGDEEYPYRIILDNDKNQTTLRAKEYRPTAMDGVLRIDLTTVYAEDAPEDVVKSATIFPGSKPTVVVKIT